MEEDPRNGEIYRKKIRLGSVALICTCLILGLVGTTAASLDDARAYNLEKLKSAVTAITPVVSSSERTSNAIPEAEEDTLEVLKKYGSKKTEAGSVADQLEKPYPYFKSQGQVPNVKKKSIDRLDNRIHQSKRSDSSDQLRLNGTVFVYVSESATESTGRTETTTESTTEFPSQSTAETTTESVTETESVSETESTTDASTITQSTEGSTTNDDLTSEKATTIPSTTASTGATTGPPLENKITSTELSTSESESPATTTAAALIMPVSSTGPTTLSTMNEPEESSTVNADVVTTKDMLSTVPEESPTTIPHEEQTTMTTLDVTAESVAPSTTTTTKAPETASARTVPILTPAETTVVTLPPTTLLTTAAITTPAATTQATTTATISVTTASTATSASSVASTQATVKSTSTSSSEPYSLITTWQDEGTTETISPTLPTEDVTLLIRIVFEGTWHDVCSKLPVLRQSLADLVNSSVDKSISPGQIVFHQTQCSENWSPTSLTSEIALTSVLVYVVDENGSFDSTLTKNLPSLYERTPINFPLTIHSFILVQEADSGNAIAVVIVSCVAFICLILLAGLLFIMRKRQGRFNYGERCRPVSLDAYSLDSVSAYNSVRRSKGVLRSSKRSYGNPTFEDSSAIPSHPLNFAGLSSFCSDPNAMAEEFGNIPQVSTKIDELPPGAELKNRYANVIPLPETRVPLQRLNNDPLTEYINASYVRGPKNANKYYIACQAPTESTVSDFWRMIWEQQCKVIIMLTHLVENGVEKCIEYIPPLEVSDCHRLYGDYQVTLKKREAKEKYAISTLHLKNLENNSFREVSHIWYLWPANGAPTDAAGLIAVLLEARALQRGAAGPIVVHCSSGTGRTGTLIAIDLGIRQYEITRTVDVPRVVYTIRRDRAGAVQTREQYNFIYKALNLYASKLAGGAIEST